MASEWFHALNHFLSISFVSIALRKTKGFQAFAQLYYQFHAFALLKKAMTQFLVIFTFFLKIIQHLPQFKIF